MLAFLVKAVVGMVLDLNDEEVEAFVGTKSPESVLETIRISQETLAIVLPFCVNNTMDLTSYKLLLKFAVSEVVNRNVPVAELQHLMNMSPNAYFRASMTVVLQVLELIKYWQVLCDGSQEAADAWFENLVVCRLNLEKVRKQISGTALIPYTHVPGVVEYSCPPSWFRPFSRTTSFRKENGPRRPPLEDFVRAALSAGRGKIILAGGAVLSLIQLQKPRDYDFWVVGCANVQEAVAVVRDAARAALSDILNFVKGRDRNGMRVLAALTPNALTIIVQWGSAGTSICLQFVLRIFNDMEHVLTSFDLGPCCFALDASGVTNSSYTVHCTMRGQLALNRGYTFADPCQHCTPARAAKYDAKGFAFVLPVWGDWGAKVLDPLSRMSMDELAKVAASGGARGIVAFACQRLTPGYKRTGKEHTGSEMGQLYECLQTPANLFNPELRARFLARFTNLRAYTYQPQGHWWFDVLAPDLFEKVEQRVTVDDLLPDELFQAASVVDGTRWSEDPAQRMHGAVGFYDGFD